MVSCGGRHLPIALVGWLASEHAGRCGQMWAGREPMQGRRDIPCHGHTNAAAGRSSSIASIVQRRLHAV